MHPEMLVAGAHKEPRGTNVHTYLPPVSDNFLRRGGERIYVRTYAPTYLPSYLAIPSKVLSTYIHVVRLQHGHTYIHTY